MSSRFRTVSSNSRFEEIAAYSRAIVDDCYVHLSGTVGSNADGSMPKDPAVQARNIMAIASRVLEGEGLAFADVVRTRVYLTDASDLMAVAGVLRETFDDIRPANTTLIVGIPAPGAKVEIEMTARLR